MNKRNLLSSPNPFLGAASSWSPREGVDGFGVRSRRTHVRRARRQRPECGAPAPSRLLALPARVGRRSKIVGQPPPRGLGGKRRSAVRRVLPVTGVVKESLANPALVRCAVPLLLAPGYDCGIPSSTPRTRAPRRAHGDAHRILWRRTRSLCGPWALHTAPRAPRCVFRDHSLASLPRRSEDSERVAA